MKNLNIKPGDQFIFLDNTLKVVEELDLRISIGYEIENFEIRSNCLCFITNQNKAEYKFSICLDECIIEEFDDYILFFQYIETETRRMGVSSGVVVEKGNCFARVDLKTEDFRNVHPGDWVEVESKPKNTKKTEKAEYLHSILDDFFIPKDSKEKSKSEIKAKKDQIIQVATQIYSAKIISNKNGNFESNIKSSIEEAIFLIEKVESLEF